MLAFAGLYEFWPDPSLPEDDPRRWLLSCTVLTTTAHDSLGHVHDRAPVIIPPSMFGQWLDPDTTNKAIAAPGSPAAPVPEPAWLCRDDCFGRALLTPTENRTTSAN